MTPDVPPGFEDATREALAKAAPQGATTIEATPFEWIDPAHIPPREWLYGRHLIRGFVSVTVGAGGGGKSSIEIAEALAMATGRDLVGARVHGGPFTVWYFNLEDPADELQRRVTATMQRYGIPPDEVAGRLYLDSGRKQPLCIAHETRNGIEIVEPVVDALVSELRRRGIDGLIVDPFVSSHGVPESDNGAIDRVAKTWGRVAEAANCAVELVHHIRKTGDAEVTAESARGAVALTAAARSVRVLQKMTKDEAAKAGIDDHERRAYSRAERDKANMSPPEAAAWFRMVPVPLANGDHVAVAEAWNWPDAFEGLTAADLRKVQDALHGRNFRKAQTADQWAGHEIGRVLGFETESKAGKARAGQLLKEWIERGALVSVNVRGEDRKEHPCVAVGEWMAAPSPAEVA